MDRVKRKQSRQSKGHEKFFKDSTRHASTCNREPAYFYRYCRIIAADLLAYLHAWQEPAEPSATPTGTCEALLELLCLQQLNGESSSELRGVAHVAYERNHDVIVIKGYPFQRAKVVAALALGVMMYHEPGVNVFIEENLSAYLTNLRQLLLSGGGFGCLAAVAVLADLTRLSQRVRSIILQV